jgi:hypothetical protein
VLVLTKPVDALVGVGVEEDLGLVDIPTDGHVQALRWSREMRQVLGEELVPVSAQEA